MISVNVFNVTRNAVGSDKNISPKFVKLLTFGNVMSIDMTLPKLAIFTIEVNGENFVFVGSS